MKVDAIKTTELVQLAKEARQDYQTARLDPTTKVMVLIQRRDTLEARLLELLTYLEEHWPSLAKRIERLS